MSEAKLYVRRCPQAMQFDMSLLRITVGKLYEVTNPYTTGRFWEIIIDSGITWQVARNAPGGAWQVIWLLPDGSEVPAL